MKIKEPIVLTYDRRKELEEFCKNGVHSAKLITRARVILSLDTSGGRKPESLVKIAKSLGITRQTIHDTRRDFLRTDNTSAFLQRKKRETPPVPIKITGEVEAHVIALACTEPPVGYAKWTLSLLAQKSVELRYIGSVSAMSIYRLLKKRNLSLT